MGLNAKSTGTTTEREVIPAGLQRAVCVSVADLGTHMNEQWGKLKRLVRLTFELADVRDDFEVDGETKNLPRLIGKNYTLSMHEKANLRKDMQSWRKRAFTQQEADEFDFSTLLGVPCMLNVEHYTGHDGKLRAGIGSIVSLMEGMDKPTPEGTTYYYGIDDHGQEFPEGMPDFVKEKVLASIEMGAQAAPAPAPAPTPMAAPAPTPTPQQDMYLSDEDQDLPF